MISAKDKNWNSSTTLYLARRLQSIASDKRYKLAVLDMGCGDGTTLECLLDYDYELYGYDFSTHEKSLRNKLEPYWGENFGSHIRFMTDEKVIPFEQNLFDVVYANFVFEHVRFFETMVSECARVLKPGGILLSSFPLATCPIEPHLKIPIVHWLPPGRLRIKYLQLFYTLRFRGKKTTALPLQEAVDKNRYLKDCTYYRFINEVESIGKAYFESVELETHDFLASKLDLLQASPNRINQILSSAIQNLPKSLAESLCTYLIAATFRFQNPKVNTI